MSILAWLGFKSGEKNIMTLRRHWFVFFLKILFWGSAAIVPIIFFKVLGDVFSWIYVDPIAHPLFILAVSTYYLYIWLFAFYSFIDYYLDVWIVTNRRVINVEQKGLFNRQISEQDIFKVQDVTSELKGFFPTFLNYGEVYIQTAGTENRFIFKQVANPRGVARKIAKIIEKEKKYQKMLEQKAKIHSR